MVRANQDIREAARDKGVFLWQVAEKCKVSDTSFSKILRRELPKKEKDQIMKVIGDLAKQEDR